MNRLTHHPMKLAVSLGLLTSGNAATTLLSYNPPPLRIARQALNMASSVFPFEVVSAIIQKGRTYDETLFNNLTNTAVVISLLTNLYALCTPPHYSTNNNHQQRTKKWKLC